MTTTDEDPFDPEEQDVEPVKEEASEPDATGAGKTPAQAALTTLNGDQRSDLIGLAHTLNLPNDDPAWLVVRAALEAREAASVASEVVGKLTDVPAAIERAALSGAINAAAEIQQHAAAGAEAIAAKLGDQIEAAAVEPFRKALKPYVRDLKAEASDVRSTIWDMTKYRIDRLIAEFLTKTTKEIDRRSVASKTAGRMSAIVLLIVGAALGVAGTKLDHRLSPTPIHSTASGSYTIRVPHDFGGRFQRCGAHECVYLYPPRRTQSNRK